MNDMIHLKLRVGPTINLFYPVKTQSQTNVFLPEEN